MKNVYVPIIAFVLLLAGCKTEFNSFQEAVKKGITFSQVKAYLEANDISYQFLSCKEISEQLSSFKKECTSPESKGAFQGLVNDGAYTLGMGSSDVYFQIEIGSNNQAVDINLDEIYTFL